jgi:hypothetical protein
VSALERVHDHHERDRRSTECREHRLSLTGVSVTLPASSSVRESPAADDRGVKPRPAPGLRA